MSNKSFDKKKWKEFKKNPLKYVTAELKQESQKRRKRRTMHKKSQL